MLTRSLIKMLLLPVFCLASTVQATPIIFNPTDSGLFDYIVRFSPYEESYANTQDPLSKITNDYGHPSAGIVQSAAYLIFDLQSQPFDALSATLQFNFSTAFGEEGNLTAYSLDTVQPGDLAALAPGEELPIGTGQPIWDDLTSGPLLAPVELGKSGEINFTLNATALSQINNAGGLWGLGLRGNFGLISVPIGGLQLAGAPQLILSDTASTVPAPNTLTLAFLAMGLIGMQHRRNLYKASQSSN